MAKKKAAKSELEEFGVLDPEEALGMTPYILVESPDGSGIYRMDVLLDGGRERVLHVGGVAYEHCADAGDGRWIYRATR